MGWIDDYLEHVDSLTERKARFVRASSPDDEWPITVILYAPVSADDSFVSFTAGLSNGSHEAWKFGRPELCISMRSTDERWGWAIGDIAHKLKGDCPFCFGDVVRFGTQISEESEMSAFVVFAPNFISKPATQISLPDWTINLAQMYPIYEGEIDYIESSGLEKFLSRPGSFFEDPKRLNLSKS